MASPDQIHRAQEAKRLLNEPLLAEAMETVRMNALIELGTIDPTDIAKITQLQAVAGATMQLFDFLRAAILSSGEQDGGLEAEIPSGE